MVGIGRVANLLGEATTLEGGLLKTYNGKAHEECPEASHGM